MYNLAALYINQHRYDEAEPVCVEMLEIQCRVLSEEHPDTLNSMDVLSHMLKKRGKRSEAKKLSNRRKKILRELKQRKKTQKSNDQAGISTNGKPVGWWKCDEGSGSTATNSGSFGSRYDGSLMPTFTNCPVWTKDAYDDNALEFDGVDDYISIPALNLNSNTVTISAWIKRNGEQAETHTGIVFSGDGSTTAGLSFGHGEGWIINHELAYEWNGGQATWGWHSGLFIPDNQWVFVALVVKPTQANLYLGEKGTLSSATNEINHGIEEFDGVTRIGHDRQSQQRHFKGTIDDVRIYNYALNKDEIAAIYAGRELGPVDKR